jgi:serine/threonine protein kinase
MLTGKKPFDGFDFTPLQIAFKVALEKLRPALPADANPILVDLIKTCWDDDPDKRFSIEQILKVLDTIQ